MSESAPRKLFISGYQLGALEAYHRFCNVLPLPPVDVRSLFYSTVFQAGVRKLEVPRGYEEQIPDSEFLSDRLDFVEVPEYMQAVELLEGFFQQYLPLDSDEDEEYQPIWKVMYFVAGLLTCAGRGTSMVNALPLPDPLEFESLAPPELVLPFGQLLAAVQRAEPPLPLPRAVVNRDDVLRLEEIIRSDLFVRYGDGHAELEAADHTRESALEGLVSRGRELFSEYADDLKLRRLAVTSLTATSKLLGTVCGGLGSAVADFVAEALNRSIEARRRIVVYQVDDILMDLTVGRARAAFRHLRSPEECAE